MINPQMLADMVQQAHKLQEQLQAELARTVVTGEAGGGLVRVVMTAAMEVKSVKIDKTVLEPPDPALLEDLVRAAVSQAVQAVEEARIERTRSLASALPLQGLGIPGLG